MTAYYKQFDKSDLDSWQGIEIGYDEKINDDHEYIETKEIEQEFYITTLEDYGMSWRDFI
jgi:hypothetical protein